jgi:MFS family permease
MSTPSTDCSIIGVVKAEEAKHPGIFGPRGGLSRVFSLVEVAATSGMTIGPILAGALTERFGYYRMCWTLSKIFPIPFCSLS